MNRRIGILAAAAVAGLAVPPILSVPGLQNLTAVMVLVTGALAAVPLVPLMLGRRFDIFEPVYVFAASFAVLFVVKPAWDLAQPGGVPPFAGESPDATYAAALAIAAIGAAGFYLAYYLHPQPREAVGSPRAHRTVVVGRLNRYVVGLILITVALYGALVATSGGLGALVVHASGYLYSAPLLLAPAGMLLILAAPSWMSPRAMVGVLLVGLSQVSAFIGGARSWTLPVLTTLGLLFFLQRRSRPSLAWVALGSVPVFLLFVSAPRDYRGPVDSRGPIIESIWSTVSDPGTAIDRFLRVGDTSMAPDLAIELQFVPSSLDYQFGATYIEALMRPVPRNWWPSKPVAADTRLMAVIWPAYLAQGIGFSFSAFGEPYLNFGIAGVAAFGVLAGTICSALYGWLVRRPGSQVAQAVFAVSWPFVFVYMRGGIGVDYQRQVILLVPLVVGYAFAWRPVPGDRTQLEPRTANGQAGRYSRMLDRQ